MSRSVSAIVMVVAAAVVAVLAAASVSAGAEWDAYPGEGTPIQTAIDGAGEGDTIYVHAGEYCENVDVAKRVTLIGDGADVVTVRAADARDHVFNVSVDGVNVSGFAVAGAGYLKAGIHLSNGVDHCNISDNNASNNEYGIIMGCSSNNTLTCNIASNNVYGIRLQYSSNNVLANNIANSNNRNGILLVDSSNHNILQNNTASNNYDDGVHICSSSENTLVNNTVSNNYPYGVLLWRSSSNMLENNTMSGNRYNFCIKGEDLSHYIQNIDTSNGVDEKPIYYWVDQQDKQVPDDAGFVGVVNSTNITVADLTLTNNGQGVLFANMRNSRIENVDASNNWHGIYLYSSINNTLMNNTVSDNWHGIHLFYSSNNMIHHNNLIDNSYTSPFYTYCTNVLDHSHGGTNQWDSGSAGNYYSDYNGTDNNTDGIGDDPRPIGGVSVDRYPLMHPWSDTQLLGDLNADGSIASADAAIALEIAVGSRPFDDAADVSRDGKVTSLDALLMLQAAAGAIGL